jgi:alkylation response protein AidB-like acyl-CoA dehydrogenase
MNFLASEGAQLLREQVRAILDREWPYGNRGHRIAETAHNYQDIRELRLRLARYGLFRYGIPEEYGGLPATVEERYAVASELFHRGVPHSKIALNIGVPMLLRHGSESLKRALLPQIAAGEAEFTLGYTEPGAGSDLSALNTSATQDGDAYVVRGLKLYTSYMHRAEYCLLAVRTDRTAAATKGISLLIADVRLPGIQVSPLWCMGDIRANVVHWDDVRVPREFLLGEENQGWSYLRTALGFESLVAFPVEALWAFFDDLVDACLDAEARSAPIKDTANRRTIARLFARVQALETLTWRNIWRFSEGLDIRYEASEVKVLASELKQAMADFALEVLGPLGQLTPADTGSVANGAFYRASEGAAVQLFGGGANEIHRDLIARFGHGIAAKFRDS